jgi:hypothetical protein
MKTEFPVRRPLKVFVSSSRKDAKLTHRLAHLLRAADFDVFLDSFDLPPSETWQEALREHLHGADAVVLLVTPAALDSPWMMRELGMAEAFDKPVIPVVVGLEARRLPEPLQSYQTVSIDQLPKAVSELMMRETGRAKE